MEKMQLRSEQLVINAILSDPQSVHAIMSAVSADMFQYPAHNLIFQGILNLYLANEVIDLISTFKSVSKIKSIHVHQAQEELTKIYSMFTAVEKQSTPTAIQYLVAEAVRHEHVDLADRIKESTSSDGYSPENVLSMLQEHIMTNKFKSIKNKNDNSNAAILEALERKMIEAADSSGISGIRTGYDRFDTVTSGMQPTNLIIVAARPAMGKTQFALGICVNASIRDNKKGLFVSCEMDEVQLMKRIIAVDSGIKGYNIKRGRLERHEVLRFEKSKKRIAESSLKIEAGSFTITEVLSLIYKLYYSEGLDYVVIDYLQKIKSPSSKDRTREVADVSGKLKDAANELKIPIVALAQLSRSVEHRTDKKPMLSDLKESGDIEQDADIVTFLYRPSYYMDHTERENNPMSEDGYAIIAKHRDGELEDIYLKFVQDIPAWVTPGSRMYDLNEYSSNTLPPNIDFDYQGDNLF